MSKSANQVRKQERVQSRSLGSELRVFGTLSGILIVCAFAVLASTQNRVFAIQWLLQGSALFALVYWMAARRLDLNRSGSDSCLYPDLGWANRLTLLRGLLIAITGGFLFQPWPDGAIGWIPGIAYSIAAIIDRLDGYIARRSGRPTLLGNYLDISFDALGLLVAPLLAVWYGQIHESYLLVSVAYYAFLGGMCWRRRNGLAIYSLQPKMSRRAVAGFQMGFVAVILLPLFSPPMTQIAGHAFMLPLLAGFLIDWLVVSGRIDAEVFDQSALVRKLLCFSDQYFLPGIRLTILVSVSLIIYDADFSQWNLVIPAGFIIAAVCIVVGIASRVFALLLVLLLGWFYQQQPLSTADIILLWSVVWLMILGPGRYSLWCWDDDWVNRYDG